jgi:hypothetical protein
VIRQLIQILALLGPANQHPLGAPRCEPTPERRAEYVTGEVRQGSSFRGVTAGGWIFRLIPIEWGWSVEVTREGREDEDLSRLTPPWHFVPNPRHIEGWHFRNSDNTAPNDGGVNAPLQLREFIFSPEVGRGLAYQGSATTEAVVTRIHSFGRGWLHVDAHELTPLRRGERAAFTWLRFSACLTWPTG